MRLHNAITAFLACLALTGYAAADDPPADTSHRGGRPWPPRVPPPTAMAFIDSRPELSTLSQMLRWAGYERRLSGPFYGTLLLPTNDAIDAYISRMRYVPSVSTNDLIGLFWDTIIKYHMLSRAASTKQRWTTEFETNHIQEPQPPTTTTRTLGRHQPRPLTPGRFHTVTFLRGGTLHGTSLDEKDGNVSMSTFWRYNDVYGVRDEQGNEVSFASTNQPLLGGGLAHVVNAVLQPDDVFTSVDELLGSRPDLSIFREILEELNMTTIWPPNCVWVSDSYYQGELYQCRRPNVTDRCIPCWQSSYTCGWNGDYSFMQEGCDGFGYYPWMPELMRRLTSSRSLQQAVFTNASDATRAIEGYAGTMAFPNNKAFGGLPPITSDFNFSIWRPVVQNHFIAAAKPPVPITSSELVRYEKQRTGGFGTNPLRQTVLGQMRNDRTYNQLYSVTGNNCGDNKQQPCLSITYPALGRNGVRFMDTLKIVTKGENLERKPGLNLQTPGHFFHIVDKVMFPICGTDDMCNRRFFVQGSTNGK